MRCANCQFENPEGMNFCGKCATPLTPPRCRQCGFDNPDGFTFCGKCGAALTAEQKAKQSKRERKKPAGTTQRKVKGQGGHQRLASAEQAPASPGQTLDSRPRDTRRAEGERRQLTVMFCDLVGSTALSAELDPEEYQAVVQAYQKTCTTIIERYAGRIAQHLGDGILAYFGYPTAHEDDASRAVRASLEMLTAIQQPPPPPGRKPVQIRIGIHTGLVVVGEIGGGEKHEILALGETPNLAARLQGIAEPNTVILSAVTQRLVAGLFDCQELKPQSLKGITTPMTLYRVVGKSTAQHRLDVIQPTGLTPLVGREEELSLLQRRWEQVMDHEGQVVLLSGEPGIGKSRLVRELRQRVEQDNALRIEFRCSPYYQNSALQPVIEHLQRLLQWQKDDTPQTKLNKLQTTLARYHFPQADTLPLLAALLSLPHPPDTPPLNMSPQRQKQKTEEALIAWQVEESEQAPVYCVWEDLHWADPSTLELLGQLLDQAPTTRLFVLLTSRPEFTPPWGQHSHFSQLTLSRLGKRQAPQMIARVAGNKPLPEEVVQQIVAKTDGVPLYVEELTKMVLESGLLTETKDHYELTAPLPPLAIPSTLQDSLMARLDRLATTKELAQLGATLGREFSYELLQAVSSTDEPTLQQGLQQLVEAELLYQRGTPPHATYLFKHALIQDTAYQSLLKSRRQQLHQQIAQVLEDCFPDTKAMQPELLAQHYTEAGLISQAIPYWQQAGLNAVQRSANMEAVNHLTRGLDVLQTLPDAPERAQQELDLLNTIGPAWMAVKGYAAPEVEQVYSRARVLCQQLRENSQLFTTLRGLWIFYGVRAEFLIARELGEQLLQLAQNAQDQAFLLEAHYTLWETLFYLGEFPSAYAHIEQGIALYDLQRHRSHAFLYGVDPGVFGLSRAAYVLWLFGYPEQAMQRSQEALKLAQELAHSNTLGGALGFSSGFYQLCRDRQKAEERAEAAIAFTIEQGLPFWLAAAESCRGWRLTEQGQVEEGIAQIRQALAAYSATGAEAHFLIQPLIALAEVYLKAWRSEEGVSALAKAMALMNSHEERWLEAEIYRLKGELTLQSSVHRLESRVKEAEKCFLKAIEVARKQQAKSLELRAVMSLARLWRQRGKTAEARQQLAEIYDWFTEGFDTKDLQEAKALLDELRQ